MKETNDLTEGNLATTMIAFTVPFFLANLIQALYGAADLMVIGWFCSPASVAGVSTGTQVTQIIASLISGLTLGCTVLIGKYTGMDKKNDVKETIATSLTLFLITGVLLTLLLLLFVRPILTLLKAPQASFELSAQYVSVCSLGCVFICGYNAVSAILRGYGDSRRPLYFVAVAGGLNFLCDILFVKYFRMGVRGVALATILSQGVSMVFAMVYLNRRNFLFKFRRSSLKMNRQKAGELLRLGIPISLQECMVRLSFLYLTAVTNKLGILAASAVGIASKYDVFAMLPATSAANALSAIVAQNHGAGKYKRMNQSLVVGILLALPFSLAFFLWAQLAPESMIRLFSQDADIIRTGIPFFRTCSFDYLCTLFVFTLNGYLNGRSKTIFTMVSCCFGALLLRMPLIYTVCRLFPDSLGIIGTVAPAVSGIMAVYTLIYVVRLVRESAVP